MTPFERKVVHDAVAAVDGRAAASPRASSPSAAWWSCPADGLSQTTAPRCAAAPAAPARAPPSSATALPVARAATPRCSPAPASSAACSVRARRRGCGSGTCSTAPVWPSCCQPGAVVVDLGSGAGLPGVVLAALRPDVTVVLVEPLLRRATFLEEVVAELGLPRRRRPPRPRRGAGRQACAGRRLVDVVVAAPSPRCDRLAGWALPLLRPRRPAARAQGRARRGRARRGRGRPCTAAVAESAEVVVVGDEEQDTAGRVVVATPWRRAARPPRRRAARR